MKLKEFKAWLEGYSNSFVGSPSYDQWEEIKNRLDKVTEDTVVLPNYPVYTPPYNPNYPSWPNTYITC